jgi:hypothetical protein
MKRYPRIDRAVAHSSTARLLSGMAWRFIARVSLRPQNKKSRLVGARAARKAFRRVAICGLWSISGALQTHAQNLSSASLRSHTPDMRCVGHCLRLSPFVIAPRADFSPAEVLATYEAANGYSYMWALGETAKFGGAVLRGSCASNRLCTRKSRRGGSASSPHGCTSRLHRGDRQAACWSTNRSQNWTRRPQLC